MADKLKLSYVPIFLAGTGYGKSLIFEAVAAHGGKKKVTLIICPLKALEADQVNQAREKGIKAVMINEDNTKDPVVWKTAEKTAQLVYISPEMALSDRFGKLWTDVKFHGRVQALIVDEAHCINEWGEEFRVPFVACTATCATRTFNIIWNSLGFGHRPFWGLDAGVKTVDFTRMLYVPMLAGSLLSVGQLTAIPGVKLEFKGTLCLIKLHEKTLCGGCCQRRCPPCKKQCKEHSDKGKMHTKA
ncbi:P-loop containing nucleoside triphosphate hydrolase protein [Mycena sp. CBHHK59/15]|nr:P-loop containing nucleoside triphosphate hydrolase protein [Mycena sp. CBHHK59/15]